MPERKRMVPGPDGREVEATVMPFQVGGEHWNEYVVDDGTIVKLKPVVTEIMRVDGHFDQNGDPVYVVQATNVLAVSAPDDLRKKD